MADGDDEVLEGEIVRDDPEGDADAGRLETLLQAVLTRVRATVVADVARLRAQQPGLADEDLARLVVRRGTRRVGWASFATGFGGVASAAVNVPSVLVLQTVLVLSVAEVYGQLDSDTVVQDVALVVGGDSAANALRLMGMEVSDDFSQGWVRRNVTRQTMKKVNRVVSRRILAAATERSLRRVTRLVPVVGAGVGYAIDRSYAKALGERAIRYYGGR